MKYEKVKLGEILNIRRGSSPRPIIDFLHKESSRGIPWIKISDATKDDTRYIRKTEQFVSFEGSKKSVRVFPGDLILSNSGTAGIPKFLDIEACIHDGWQLIKIIDESKIDINYLYYFFLTKREEILHGGYDSVMKNLTLDQIRNFEIELPPLSEQKRIADILTSLDDKIELNNQMNQTLEEMAKVLYKQWFVDFEFPNEDGKPYKSSGGEMVESELGLIPKGWGIIGLNEIMDVFNGYSYKGTDLKESNDAMVTIKNFNRNGDFKEVGFKEISISDKVKGHHYVNKGDVLIAHTDLTQNADIIGNPIIVMTEGKYEKLIYSMDIVKVQVKNKKISNSVLKQIFSYKLFKNHALKYTSGTTVLHLSKKAIPEYKIAFPVKIETKHFSYFNFLLEKQMLILEENKLLEKTKGEILNKLL